MGAHRDLQFVLVYFQQEPSDSHPAWRLAPVRAEQAIQLLQPLVDKRLDLPERVRARQHGQYDRAQQRFESIALSPRLATVTQFRKCAIKNHRSPVS
jgi:hypothetical protein